MERFRAIKRIVAFGLATAMFVCQVPAGVAFALEGEAAPLADYAIGQEIATGETAAAQAELTAEPAPAFSEDSAPAEEQPEEEPTSIPEPTLAPTAEDGQPAEEPSSTPTPQQVAATKETAAEEEPTPEAPAFAGLENYPLTEQQRLAKETLASGVTLAELGAAIEGTDYAPGQVMFATEDATYAQAVAEALGGTLVSFQNGVAVINLPETITVEQAVAAAAMADTNLPALEPNYSVDLPQVDASADEAEQMISAMDLVDEIPYAKKWADYTDKDPYLADFTKMTYQWQHEAVNTYEAWGVTKGDPAIQVAIIDSGIYTGNVDIGADKVTMAKNYTASATAANSHGTHVAGLVAALAGNEAGGAGIAPGVSLQDYQILEANGSGNTSNVAVAINAAVENGADIINLSVGSYNYSSVLQGSINNAYRHGIVVVAAASNDGTNGKLYPAGYEHIVCVGATNRNGSRASFSNYGDWVTAAAPGVNLYSTGTSQNSFIAKSGTSQATPVVSGVIALYMSAAGLGDGDVNGDGVRSGADVDAVIAALQATATPAASSGMGAGIVNAGALLATVVDTPAFEVKLEGKTVQNPAAPLLVPMDSADSTLAITSELMDDYAIVYTTDGTTPAVSGGKAINGTMYTGPVPLSDFGTGNTAVQAVVINGTGTVGPVAQLQLQLNFAKATCQNGITLSKNLFAAPGETVQLEGSANGQGSLGWRVTAGGDIATVSSAGLVSVDAGATPGQTITVQAYLQSNTAIANTVQITVAPRVDAITIAATADGQSVASGGTVAMGQAVAFTAVATAGGNPVSDFDVVWKSSAPANLAITADGVATLRAAGAATITATATDGSGVSSTFTLRVTQPVQSIALTPASTAVTKPGSVQVTAAQTPAGADAALTWTLDSAAAAAGATVDATGLVRVPAGFSPTALTVTATATQTPAVTQSCTIEVLTTAATTLTLGLDKPGQGIYDGTKLTGVRLFTIAVSGSDFDAGAAGDETTATLSATTDTGCGVAYTSSNASVVTVDATGKLSAKADGTATITVQAQDGGSLQQTVTVFVTVPVSSIALAPVLTSSPNSGTSTDSNGAAGTALAVVGSEIGFSAKVGALYGTPDNTALTWSVDNTSASYGVVVNEDGVVVVPASTEIMQWLKTLGGRYSASVTAKAQDGSGAKASQRFYIVQPTTVLKMPAPGTEFDVYTLSNDEYVSYSTLTQPEEIAAGGAAEDSKIYFYADSPLVWLSLEGTPEKLTLKKYSRASNANSSGYFVKVGDEYYPLYAIDAVCPLSSTGQYTETDTATVTVSSADGSGISATLDCPISWRSPSCNSPELNKRYVATTTAASQEVWRHFTLPEDGYVALRIEHELYEKTGFWSFYLRSSTESTPGNVVYSKTVYAGEKPLDETGVNIGLPAGDYYLESVSSAEDISGCKFTYSLKYTPAQNWEKELNETAATATPLAFDTALNGSGRSPADQDYYTVTAEQACRIGITTAHAPVQTDAHWNLALRDADGKLLQAWQDAVNTTGQTVYFDVNKGSYTICVATGYSATDCLYSITATQQETPLPSCLMQFNANGGQTAALPYKLLQGEPVGELPTAQYTGHSFIGWYTQPEGGVLYTEDRCAPAATSLTLYAHWQANTYTLAFDPNGGQVDPEYKDITFGTEIGPMPTPTYTGYTFDGWYTARTGGTLYTGASVMDKADDLTLYAHWQANTYTLTFDPDGGVVDTASQNATFGKEIGPMPTPAYTGYTFDGWYTARTGGTLYTGASVMDKADDLTLYAHWQANTYTLTFDPNGGRVGTKTKAVKYEKKVGALTTPKRTGYTFAGWYTACTGGTLYTSTSLMNQAGDLTLYARWQASTYTLTFDPDGGRVGTKTKAVKYEKKVGALTTPKRTGYTFAGWYTARTGGTLYTSTSLMNKAGDLTLYARWISSTYTLTFDPNGGRVGTKTKSVISGKKVGTLATAKRTGYTFAGWYTEPIGGTLYTSTTVMKETGNFTLYAHWQ